MEEYHTTKVLTRLVSTLAIPLTLKSISGELEKHPNPNSLLAMSDVLNNFLIPNAAYDLTFDELLEAKISSPFIAYSNKNEFLVINNFTTDGAIISSEEHRKQEITIDELKDFYGGSILVAEKDEESGEGDYAAKHRSEVISTLRVPFVMISAATLIICCVCFYTPYLNSFNFQIALLTLFKTMALITAILLLVQSIDANNPLVRRLCGGDSSGDCNSILSSNAAKVALAIGVELSWSEVGFFYFAGTLFALLFNSNNIAVLQILALLNIISLPYTFYSIYYQWLIAKQWCILCCTIQCILWLEFFAFTPYLFEGLQLPTGIGWGRLIVSICIPVITWLSIRSLLLKSRKVTHLTRQLNTFKYNIELFQKKLNDEVLYALPDAEDTLILGNPEAKNIITIVSNPYCGPCAHTHKVLDKWLNSRDNLKLQIIFSVDKDKSGPKTQVAAHLLNLQANNDNVSLKKAVQDWYDYTYINYEAWVKAHPVANTQNDAFSTLEIHEQWCQAAEITVTPTLFINGRRLPNDYHPEDIKYFM